MKKKNLGLVPDRIGMLHVLLASLKAVQTFNRQVIPVMEGKAIRLFLLIALAEAERRPAPHVSDLMKALDVGQSTASRAVAFGKEVGVFVAVRQRDGRRTHVGLTKLGRKFVDHVLADMSAQVTAERARERAEM